VKSTNSGAPHYADSISVCCLVHTSKYVSLETVLIQLLCVCVVSWWRETKFMPVYVVQETTLYLILAYLFSRQTDKTFQTQWRKTIMELNAPLITS